LPENWQVRIGVHKDDNFNHNDWVRWPKVYTQTQIKSKKFSVTSAFGGLITFLNPAGNSTLKIKISNILEAPFYDSKSALSIANWKNRKTLVAPWGCAVGAFVGFCMPR
jgi:hypothetical protein